MDAQPADATTCSACFQHRAPLPGLTAELARHAAAYDLWFRSAKAGLCHFSACGAVYSLQPLCTSQSSICSEAMLAGTAWLVCMGAGSSKQIQHAQQPRRHHGGKALECLPFSPAEWQHSSTVPPCRHAGDPYTRLIPATRSAAFRDDTVGQVVHAGLQVSPRKPLLSV